MLLFNKSQESFEKWVNQLGKEFNAKPKDGFVDIPAAYGKGFFYGADYGSLLSISVQDFIFSKEFSIQRPVIKTKGLFLFFNNIKVSTHLSVATGKDVSVSQKGERKNIYFSSANKTVVVNSGKNNHLKRIGVFFPYATLSMFFKETQVTKIIDQIEDIDIASKRIAITPRFQHLMDDIFYLKPTDELYKFKLFHKGCILMSHFFQSLYDGSLIDIKWMNFSKTDAANLVTIEEILNDPETIEFPGIDFLAKKALMSPTKLKQVFKKLHNKTVYNYYNSLRLKKARLLLETGNYSVKLAAEEIGFKSTGHFAAAYKKEFGKLPND